MKKNIGSIDRVLRIVVAIVVFTLIAMGSLSGTWAWVLGVLSVIFVATSALGTCPIYLALGMSTKSADAPTS